VKKSGILRILKNQKGYILVSIGASLLTLISLFALVADLGHIFVTKAQLQNTADAAALASVVEIPAGELTVQQKAQEFGNAHWAGGAQIVINNQNIETGSFDFQAGTFASGATPVNAVRVEAQRVQGSGPGALQLFFAPLFGKDTSNVRARSLAVLDPHVVGVQSKNRLIPYSVIDFVVDEDGDGLFDIGSTVNIHPRNDAPGNFGFLDLDMGSNDVPELRAYIEHGYDKEFIIPPGGSVEVPGSTGITGNSLLNSFGVILNEIVFLPVHDWVAGEGDGAIFNVVALLAVRISKVKLTGGHESRYIRAEIIRYASSVLVTDPEAPANNSVAKPRLAS